MARLALFDPMEAVSITPIPRFLLLLLGGMEWRQG